VTCHRCIRAYSLPVLCSVFLKYLPTYIWRDIWQEGKWKHIQATILFIYDSAVTCTVDCHWLPCSLRTTIRVANVDTSLPYCLILSVNRTYILIRILAYTWLYRLYAWWLLLQCCSVAIDKPVVCIIVSVVLVANIRPSLIAIQLLFYCEMAEMKFDHIFGYHCQCNQCNLLWPIWK